MVHKNFLKILAFFMCMSFFHLGSGTALAANSWYVVSGDTGNQIKYYKDENATTYSNKWSQATNTSTDINTFLNDAAVQSGDTVYIKAGTYRLSGEIDLTSKILHLYGGFSGTEETSSDRESNIGATLDANSGSYMVLNITTNSTIDSFTITGGNYNGSGGGIFINSSNPTITNCTITDNTASDGGGIYIYNNSSPIITNCTITGNNANTNTGGYGGGIYIDGSNPIITNCTITGNNATGYGGGIYIFNNSTR